MRGLVRLVVATGMVCAASSAWAQRYDPAYPFCGEMADENGQRMECFYTSMEQCKGAIYGMAGTCLKNPFYKPPPPEATPVVEPVPAPEPAAKKKKKAAPATRPPPTAPPAAPAAQTAR